MTAYGFTTCLWFDGQAEEAAAHYVSIFKNSRLGHVTRYTGDAPGDAPAARAGSVMTVEFEADGQKFVALDGGPQFTFSEAVSFQIHCADQDEVDHYWNRLTEGGEPGPCGWLKDRYGVSWQVVPVRFLEMVKDTDTEKVARVTRAMYSMSKLDLPVLERAYAGE
ncbi:VOC family protein [Streptomyces ruber]|uniref:VOC family protein n=2 Tax=Streptomyces TaxID=1883 RepID=A0A918BAQ5_9ACTN|nr:VOC family protein [Streptomyces ruber]GGQ50478.1 VOC family protein [Streptomyces ruber]